MELSNVVERRLAKYVLTGIECVCTCVDMQSRSLNPHVSDHARTDLSEHA